ncbi:MAG: molybdenum cofactor guanylyltransferase [Gemmatimonadota bacterium]
MPHPPRTGVLLAGGGSTRFGGVPKGLAILGDRRLADWPLQQLDATCDEVLVAANDPAAESWFPAHRVVRDIEPGRGALGALETALRHARHETVLVCAWDMPFVTAATLSALATEVERGASCCVPEHADGALEPLCAAYAQRNGALVSQLLRDGERAAHALLAAAQGRTWLVAQHLGNAEGLRIFSNVNTADELRDASRLLADGANASRRESCL